MANSCTQTHGKMANVLSHLYEGDAVVACNKVTGKGSEYRNWPFTGRKHRRIIANQQTPVSILNVQSHF